MIKKHPYIIVAAIYTFLFCANARANNLNPLYMLQSLAIRQPVDDNHLVANIVAVVIILSVGIAFGWWLRHRLPEPMLPQKNREEPVDYPFEEWDGYHEYNSKVFHNKKNI